MTTKKTHLDVVIVQQREPHKQHVRADEGGLHNGRKRCTAMFKVEVVCLGEHNVLRMRDATVQLE